MDEEVTSKAGCYRRVASGHLHKRCGLEQTNPQMSLFVVHIYHAEANKFRYGLRNGDEPHDRRPRTHSGSFEVLPRYDSEVPTTVFLFVFFLSRQRVMPYKIS